MTLPSSILIFAIINYNKDISRQNVNALNKV